MRGRSVLDLLDVLFLAWGFDSVGDLLACDVHWRLGFLEFSLGFAHWQLVGFVAGHLQKLFLVQCLGLGFHVFPFSFGNGSVLACPWLSRVGLSELLLNFAHEKEVWTWDWFRGFRFQDLLLGLLSINHNLFWRPSSFFERLGWFFFLSLFFALIAQIFTLFVIWGLIFSFAIFWMRWFSLLLRAFFRMFLFRWENQYLFGSVWFREFGVESRCDRVQFFNTLSFFHVMDHTLLAGLSHFIQSGC